jgi:hypothetical protein
LSIEVGDLISTFLCFKTKALNLGDVVRHDQLQSECALRGAEAAIGTNRTESAPRFDPRRTEGADGFLGIERIAPILLRQGRGTLQHFPASQIPVIRFAIRFHAAAFSGKSGDALGASYITNNGRCAIVGGNGRLD